MKEKQPSLKKRNFKISTGTIITIVVLIAIFAIINFVVFPMVFKTESPQNVVQLPIIKRGDVEFVDQEVAKRTLVVPPLVAPENAIGKANPFE
ncbi:MAG: hypothetical protein ACPLZB_04925 [Caldisericaceae bacterium]